MKFFEQVVRTTVNIVILPTDVVRDLVAAARGHVFADGASRTACRLKTIKDEAREDHSA